MKALPPSARERNNKKRNAGGLVGSDVQSREEQILDAAARLFKEKGYRGAKLQDVAKRIGLSRTVVYYYFPSKEALLYRILDQAISDIATTFEGIVGSDAEHQEKLHRLVRSYILCVIRIAPSWWVLLADGEQNLPSDQYTRLHGKLRQLDAIMQRAFAGAVQAGKLVPLNPKIAVFAIAGMCNWLTRWYDPQGEVTPNAVADVFLRILEHGYLVGTTEGAKLIAPAPATNIRGESDEGTSGPDVQVRKERILEVAARLFRERGYRGATLQDVADEIGVSRTVVYYHFPSKEELLYQILDETITQSTADYDVIINSGAPPSEMMHSLVRLYILSAVRIAPSWWVLLTEGEQNLPPRKYRRLHGRLRQLDDALQRVFANAVRTGKFAPLNPKIAVFAIAGMCNWLTRWYDPQGEVDVDSVADVFLHILEHGYFKPELKLSASQRIAAYATDGVASDPV